MKQPKNNSAILLLLTVLALVAGSISITGKLAPFITHTFSYCESVVQTLSWQLPPWVMYSLLLTGVSLIFISLAKVILVSVHAFQLRKKTIRYEFSPQQQKLLQSLSLSKQVKVIHDSHPAAFCFGLLKPSIYISDSLLSILSLEELETILRHEQYHLEHKDTVIMLAIYSIRHFFPFFPLLSDLIRNYRIEREIRADQSAIAGRGESASLVSVLKKLLKYDRAIYAFAPALADEETLDARIQALVHGNFHFQAFRLQHIIVSIFSLGILGGIFFIPVQASEADPQKNAVMVCFYSNEKVVTPHLNKSVPYSPVNQ